MCNIFKDAHILVEQIKSGRQVTRWKKYKYIYNDRRIREAQREYEAQHITRLHYLKRCSYSLLNYAEELRNWAVHVENFDSSSNSDNNGMLWKKVACSI